MQICIRCNKYKSLNSFYKHNKMANGYLNVCKECKKTYSRIRDKVLRNDNTWVESERERSRDKYYRLGYRSKKTKTKNPKYKRKTITKYFEKYPEKRMAHSICSSLKHEKGYNLHHWSYNTMHFKDVIKIENKFHYYLHRHLIYVQDLRCYKTFDGILLDTKQKHLDFINKLAKELQKELF